MKNQHNSVGRKDQLTPLYLLFIVIFIIWNASSFVVYWKINNWQDRGAFGDSFGAVNSLFSSLAFAGIIYTILLQRKELTLQRQELAATREELKRSANAQEKAEEALSKQIISSEKVAKINALASIIEHHNSENQLRAIVGNNRLGLEYYSPNAEYVRQLEMIIKDIDKQH